MNGAEPESPRAALVDACALVPIRLATTLMWLAEAGVFELLWSDEILDEVRRTLPKIGLSLESAERRVSAMRGAFGEAALVDDFDDLIAALTCDPKDRHVLAAALRAEADLLVTFNLKDFPPASTEGSTLEVTDPDTFLTTLLAADPAGVIKAVERGCATLRNPTQTATQFLASLTGTVPIFANLGADQILSRSEQPDQQLSPFTGLVRVDDDESLAAFGEIGDLTNPAQVALGWWACLRGGNNAVLRALTYDPSAWGDYRWALDMLANKSPASRVIRAVDAPDRIAFLRFVPEVASSAKVCGPYLTSATFLTLLKVEDGTWQVWGLGPAVLTARNIIADQ